MYNPDQDLPGCMMPDGGEACGSYVRLLAEFKAQSLKLGEREKEIQGWIARSAEQSSRLDSAEKRKHEQQVLISAYVDETEKLRSRLGSVTDQNRYLRKWIAELRDTQEERGHEPADPLYSMLIERIEPLMKADPAPESIDGARLLELVGLCEAYEKRKGEWPAAVEKPPCECPQEGVCLGMVNEGQRCMIVEKHRQNCGAPLRSSRTKRCILPSGHVGDHAFDTSRE